MTKFQLIVFSSCGDKLYEEKSLINGFVNAEERAVELWNEYHSIYLDNVQVALLKSGDAIGYYGYFVYTRDAAGDLGWMVVRWGFYYPLYTDILRDYEEYQLEEWRSEQDVSILDLTCDDLRKLYSEISFGSIYTSDYENSLGVDEDEVFHYSEMFLKYMYKEGREESFSEEDWVIFITDYC